MITVILVLHLLICIVMISLILLQKTEGGAAGAGFSGSASIESAMRPRARPNPMTRATTVLGICFFATSLGLALLAKPQHVDHTKSIMDEAPKAATVPKIDDTPVVPTTTPATPGAPATAPAGPDGPAVPNN